MAKNTILETPPSAGSPATSAPSSARWSRMRRYWGLIVLVPIASVLYTHSLSQNGYANTFYAAGVKSMLRSWHNFFFVSFDPGGLVMIDKPPLGLWVQAASAKLFGFSPLSLLLPEAIAGVLAVGVVYVVVEKRFGILAAIVGGLSLALFPSFVAVARDNNVDALLILLMVLGCAAAIRAVESGHLSALIASAVLLALAFNTKALAAYLAVPGVFAAYVYCAPGGIARRARHSLIAGVVLIAVSLVWIVAVDVTPVHDRPFVGGSTDNSELGLTFAYNGFGRVGGQLGGPGPVPQKFLVPSGATARVNQRSSTYRGEALEPAPDLAPAVDHSIVDNPVAFGKSPGLLRLFGSGMGSQGAWLLPFALIGLLALLARGFARRDPRLAVTIVFGGFFLIEVLVLSFSGGIVHPYYVSALAPGVAVMVGAGTRAIGELSGRRRAGALAAAMIATVAVQVTLLEGDHYLRVWIPILIAVTAVGIVVVLVRAHAFRFISVLLVAAVLVAPAAYSFSTWRRPVESTFPAAGPRAVGGYGGAGISPESLAANSQLIRYVLAHQPSQGFQLLTQASVTAAAPILLGLRAAALGGYGGIDPALDGRRLGRLVREDRARYVLIGGGYAYLGGNQASRDAERVCRQVPPSLWSSPGWATAQHLYLLDCGGLGSALERQLVE